MLVVDIGSRGISLNITHIIGIKFIQIIIIIIQVVDAGHRILLVVGVGDRFLGLEVGVGVDRSILGLEIGIRIEFFLEIGFVESFLLHLLFLKFRFFVG